MRRHRSKAGKTPTRNPYAKAVRGSREFHQRRIEKTKKALRKKAARRKYKDYDYE